MPVVAPSVAGHPPKGEIHHGDECSLFLPKRFITDRMPIPKGWGDRPYTRIKDYGNHVEIPPQLDNKEPSSVQSIQG